METGERYRGREKKGAERERERRNESGREDSEGGREGTAERGEIEDEKKTEPKEEREREKKKERVQHRVEEIERYRGMCVCVGVGLRDGAKERGIEREGERGCMHRHVNNVKQQRTRCAHRGDNPEGYI